MRRTLGWIAALLIIVSGLGALSALSVYWSYGVPGPLTEAHTVIIPKGSSVADIAALLQREQVVSSGVAMRAVLRATGESRDLRAGEYAFPPRISARDAVALLKSGEVVRHRFTVPEGWSSRQVTAMINATPGLVGSVAIPEEGSLLPETYFYTYADDRSAVIARMRTAMTAAIDQAWRSRAPDLPLATPRDAVILASIIEKETSIPEERARIAAVFINRLRQGMRLQADPTVVYALFGGDDANNHVLTAADLQLVSPYNTYVVDGLPAGPITNPGRASLAAALRPANTDDLYFVADGSGGHVFARTLEEHNRNVARWRRFQHDSSGQPVHDADGSRSRLP